MSLKIKTGEHGDGSRYIPNFKLGWFPDLNSFTLGGGHYPNNITEDIHSLFKKSMETISQYWKGHKIPKLILGRDFFEFADLLDESFYNKLLHNDRGIKVLEFSDDNLITMEDLKKISGAFKSNRTIEYLIFELSGENCKMETIDMIFHMLLNHPTLKVIYIHTQRGHAGYIKYVSTLLNANETLQSFTWNSNSVMSLEEFIEDYKLNKDRGTCPVYMMLESEKSILDFLSLNIGKDENGNSIIDTDLANEQFSKHVHTFISKNNKKPECDHVHRVEENIYNYVVGTLRFILYLNTSIKLVDVDTILIGIWPCENDRDLITDIKKEYKLNQNPKKCIQKNFRILDVLFQTTTRRRDDTH